MNRQSKDFYYLSVAEAVSSQSTCLSKKYGAIIVKDDVIVSTGYNGAPRGRINCCDRGICYRAEHNIPRGTRYEFCLHPNTRIKLLNGTIMTIKDMAKSDKKLFWVYAVDTNTGEIVPAQAINVRKTKKVDRLVRVTFDDGGYIECTSDHLIMRRDCSYTEAGKLNIGDSVMPMYYVYENADHEYIYNTPIMRKESRHALKHTKASTNKIPTHILVYKYIHGNIIPGNIIHHNDFNSRNNDPDNLVQVTHGDHTRIHWPEVSKTSKFNTLESKIKAAKASHLRFLNDPEFRSRKSAIGRANMNALWNNPAWVESRKKISSKSAKNLAATYNSDPDIILKRRKTVVAKGISLLMWNMFVNKDNTKITDTNYEKLRRKYKCHDGKGKNIIPKYKNIIKYYDSFEGAIEAGRYYNHKVTKIEQIEYSGWVYDMEVPKYHNFAVAVDNNSCVFVHNCRSVHAEANAIIAASRESMKHATMYVYGYDTRIKGPVVNVNSCLMCKRMIINAGIERVVFADPEIGVPSDHGRYHAKSIIVQEWIDNDDSLDPDATY